MNGLSLQGCFTALVTPFTADERVDESGLKALVDWQIDNGVQGLVPCGTTGESATLDEREYRRVFELVITQANKRVPVICGAGGNDTRKVIKLARMAKEAGADALLSVTPYYNKPTQAGLIAHYQALADAVDIPIVMYNVPGRTAANMSAETCLRLAETPNIIGIKEASGDIVQIMQILRDRPQGFFVLAGDDALALPLIAAGADGVISVAGNQIPREFSRLINVALRGDFAAAQKLQMKYLRLMQLNFVESNPIPVKTALALMGKITETFRLPLTPMQPATRAKLVDELRNLQLID